MVNSTLGKNLLIRLPGHRGRFGTPIFSLHERKGTSLRECWRVRGYESFECIFDRVIPLGQMGQVSAMLQLLAARHLSADEIVTASLRRGSALYIPLLEPHVPTTGPHSVSVGANPYYIATREPWHTRASQVRS